MKRVAALLLLATLLAPAACIRTSPGAVPGHTGDALVTLDGTPVSIPELEASIEQAMQKANVAGLSVAILNDSQIAYTHAFGFRDKAAGIPSPATDGSAAVVTVEARTLTPTEVTI